MIKDIKLKGIALLLIVIGTFSSCSEDFLNPKPTTALEDEEVFTSYTNAKAAMIGAYDQLASYYFDGLYLPIMADLTGEDLMLNSERNYNWFVPVYHLNVLPNYQYASNPWSVGYKVIYDANKIIEGAPMLPDATTEEIDHLVAEAKVMRAFAMLKLVEVFADAYVKDPDAPGILLVTSPLEYDAPDLGRSPVRDVYAQIIADLTYGANTLEDGNEPGFFGKKAAQALLARTYLDMQDWENARDWAKQAYDGMQLMSLDEMLGGFYSSNSETIFSLAYTPEDNNIYLSIPSFYWPVSGYSSMRANDKFVEKFENGDYRRYFFLKQTAIDPDNWLILKFQHNQSVGNAERISIRAAEMYLIEAECEAELGNDEKAQDALYVIQGRSHPGIGKSTNTGQELIDEILLERRKELFGEGFRWNDIKRRNLPFKREGDHWVKLDFGPGDEDYYRLTFPIPQREIDANTALTQDDQNKGY
jgi:hypothetical protein